ncbi:hypothetical protein RJZ56_001989 [Blastomyces dermatitidis]|uniref:FAM192A/Fyv6 N-terminal domain-containing protein n=1 Tax=Ajellomyces dermatitidis (strain ER-3 / ATCC MYA-2586) TaxID=559297 RepID=A0ABP2F2S0_AJEDR|nr:uncharacterized protein BDCG_05525 [Blastomyces dermatitidis ER-3]EEQ90405.1 hypothetical protein BDCG_05525 [Blastomyces dermatitidis ER-3]EQL30440.1 hypothetical protein BDFG_07033 [Blastomyces dermatitidis ATCC 26199]
MSSGFVSGGTIEEPTERDDEWVRAQQELEAERRRKAEESNRDQGKSLYEILQQNKAAKQEAFEESIKLKNQFRSLDEDEVEFLDSVLESTRAQEAALKRETREQLEIFHRQRQEAERAALVDPGSGESKSAGASSPADEEQWTTSVRKRKRAKVKDAIPGVKLRKSSSANSDSIAASKVFPEAGSKESRMASDSVEISKNQEKPDIPVNPVNPAHPSNPEDIKEPEEPEGSATTSAKAAPDHSIKLKQKAVPQVVSSALGLGAYSSDDD